MNALFPHDATTLLVNSRGRPWTENGFRVSVFKLLHQLKREKLVQKGLTIHGLRHTVAARELGFTPRAIATRSAKRPKVWRCTIRKQPMQLAV